MKSKTTPGPWIATNYVEGAPFYIYRQDATSVFHATVHGEANARLIATAPDMLLALQDALGSLEYAASVLEVPAASTFRENIEAIRKAIAKASGEPE